MKKFTVILILLLLLVTGCSKKYSEDEYNQLLSENNSLKTEIDEYKIILEDTQKKLTESNKNFEEYLNLYTDLYVKSLKGELFTAWAKTSFGEVNITSCVINGDTFSCIIKTNYTQSETISRSIKDEVFESLNTLALVSLSDDNINTLYLTFLDSSKKEYIEYIFKKSDNTFKLTGILGDVERITDIISGL